MQELATAVFLVDMYPPFSYSFEVFTLPEMTGGCCGCQWKHFQARKVDSCSHKVGFWRLANVHPKN
jgi:hypothetical protein